MMYQTQKINKERKAKGKCFCNAKLYYESSLLKCNTQQKQKLITNINISQGRDITSTLSHLCSPFHALSNREDSGICIRFNTHLLTTAPHTWTLCTIFTCVSAATRYFTLNSVIISQNSFFSTITYKINKNKYLNKQFSLLKINTKHY